MYLKKFLWQSPIKLRAFISIITFTYFVPVYAQVVSRADSHEIVEKLASELTDKYPFPEVSTKYKEALLKNEAAGYYSNLTEQDLANKLTADLQQAHKDVHLHISRNEDEYKSLTSPQASAENEASALAALRRGNYGFKNVELDGITSTAYINIPGPLYATQEAFEMAAAAVNMAAYSKYVILDVRSDPGGSGEMGRFLASYFYDAGNEQFYLNGFFKDRSKDVQEWTYSYVPGKRNPDAKVYILVGPGTGSAAEGFAYALQQLHRATIVGETTAGAGIAGTNVALKNNLVVFLPFKMVVGPNTNVGWEGTGVVPDSVTTGKDALVQARKMVWQDILTKSSDSSAKVAVKWLLDDNNAANHIAVSLKPYQSMVGRYNNNITITQNKDGLWWIKAEPGQPVQKFQMNMVKPDVFTVVNLNKSYGPNNSRVYVNRNTKGQIVNLTRRILTNDGTIYNVPLIYQKL